MCDDSMAHATQYIDHSAVQVKTFHICGWPILLSVKLIMNADENGYGGP